MNSTILPVYSARERILNTLKENQVIVVESPTGSGKTTQLPIILNEAGYSETGIIGITQPRRIAAVGVCRYIAEQLQCKIGDYVGYKMRFEDVTSASTKLKILTDGTLLQEMKNDRLLSRYSVLMIDEAHERTLNIDFILGLIKQLLPDRPEMKVIISSATLNPRAFAKYFANCPIVSIDTPVYPVKVHYVPPVIEGNDEAMLRTINEVTRRASTETEGDILIFCTGERMIKDTITGLNGIPGGKKLWILPLYARLSSGDQEKVFLPTPKNKTKVVVATNVAETSITIDGITAVIDSGRAKMNFYDSRTYTNSLIETSISRASADQRKGRAGRTRPGECYRLYPEQEFKKRPLYTREEIYRTDLTEVVLRMAEIGIKDFESFPFISPPESRGISGAVEALKLMDALDKENQLTDTGRRMVPYPLMPRHSRMIIEAITRYPDVLREVIILTAFLSTNSPFLLPQGEEVEARHAHLSFRSEYFGDFASYLNVFHEYLESGDKKEFAHRYYLDEKIMNEIIAITEQLAEITRAEGIPIGEGGSTEDFIKACTRGLIPFICVKDGRFDYRSLGSERINIHPGSVLFRENPPCIVAGEIIRTSRIYARSVSPLKKEWLEEIHPAIIPLLYGKRKNSRQKEHTDKVYIAGKVFSMSGGKRGQVLLDWDELHSALEQNHNYADFGPLRGTLIFRGTPILVNTELNTIIKACELLNPARKGFISPPGRNYHTRKKQHRGLLIENLGTMMNLTKQSKKGGKVGFIALCSDGKELYWFKSVRDYRTAVNLCLENLDILVSAKNVNLSRKQSRKLGRHYSRIEKFL